MPIPFIVKSAKGLSLGDQKKANWIGRISHNFMMRKAHFVWKHVRSQIKGKKILDVGMGAGATSFFLAKKGFWVTGVDVDNLSIYEDLKPVTYDGRKMPFKNNEFDTAIIVHVLHHCADGLEVLKEAKRVSKRVVFIEDTFRNGLEWFFIASFDAITNGEFWWHKYRKVMEWKNIIKEHGWKIIAYEQWSEGGITSPYGRYCMFSVE